MDALHLSKGLERRNRRFKTKSNVLLEFFPGARAFDSHSCGSLAPSGTLRPLVAGPSGIIVRRLACCWLVPPPLCCAGHGHHCSACSSGFAPPAQLAIPPATDRSRARATDRIVQPVDPGRLFHYRPFFLAFRIHGVHSGTLACKSDTQARAHSAWPQTT